MLIFSTQACDTLEHPVDFVGKMTGRGRGSGRKYIPQLPEPQIRGGVYSEIVFRKRFWRRKIHVRKVSTEIESVGIWRGVMARGDKICTRQNGQVGMGVRFGGKLGGDYGV